MVYNDKMNVIMLIFLLFMPFAVNAADPIIMSLDGDCAISWKETVTHTNHDAFRVHVGPTPGDMVPASDFPPNITQASCSEIGIVAAGQYYVAISQIFAGVDSVKGATVSLVIGSEDTLCTTFVWKNGGRLHMCVKNAGGRVEDNWNLKLWNNGGFQFNGIKK